MNSVQQAILDRRSIRAYQETQLSKEQLQALVDAALAAPSANDMQPWHFSVVQDQPLLQRVHDAMREHALTLPDISPRFADESFHVFYHAPTVIFLSAADPAKASLDCGIAVQNIALAAQGLGLGSVILGLPRMAFLGGQAAALRKELGFPEGFDFSIAVSVGTPATDKPAHPIHAEKVNYVR